MIEITIRLEEINDHITARWHVEEENQTTSEILTCGSIHTMVGAFMQGIADEEFLHITGPDPDAEIEAHIQRLRNNPPNDAT